MMKGGGMDTRPERIRALHQVLDSGDLTLAEVAECYVERLTYPALLAAVRAFKAALPSRGRRDQPHVGGHADVADGDGY